MSTIHDEEDIYVQMEALLQGVDGIKNVYRDRGSLTGELLPAIVLLDNKATLAMEIPSRKTVKMPPATFTIHPQIWLCLAPRDDKSNLTLGGKPAPIGPELKQYRDLIRNAIENDEHLITMLTPNGQMIYRGYETDMAIGSSLVGNMAMFYELTYVVFPPRS